MISRFPYPINKGDKLRAYNQLKLLKKHHEIFLISIDEEMPLNFNESQVKNIADHVKVLKLNLLSKLINLFRGIFTAFPFQTEYFFTRKNKKAIEAVIDDFKPDIVVCQLIRMSKYLNSIDNVPKVIDYVDVLSKGLELRKSKASFLIRPIINIEHKRVLKYEAEVSNQFDGTVIITENDKNSLPIDDKSSVKVIPNGVLTNYFTADETVQKDIDLIFVGNMSYPPNVDAVIFFTENILPIIIKERPQCKFYIVGSSPNSRIKKLTAKNIIVTGWVEDIRPFYNRAKVFIAPMQLGTGLQNKILEAMSMSLPAVISSHAAKGINANPDVEIFISDSTNEFVEKVLNLLNNEELAMNVGNNARKFVETNYDWEKIGIDLDSYFEKIVNDFKLKSE